MKTTQTTARYERQRRLGLGKTRTESHRWGPVRTFQSMKLVPPEEVLELEELVIVVIDIQD